MHSAGGTLRRGQLGSSQSADALKRARNMEKQRFSLTVDNILEDILEVT